MYQRSTIMDAFNAAGRFHQQLLVNLDEYKREEEDAKIRNWQVRLQEEAARYANDVENGLISNDDDDYMPGWMDKSNKMFQEAIGNSKDPYTRRALDFMFKSNDARMRPALEEKSRLVRNKKAMALDADTRERVLSGEGAASDKFKYSQDLLDEQYVNGKRDGESYIAETRNGYVRSYFGDLQKAIDKAIFVDGKRPGKEMDNVLENFRKEHLDTAVINIYDSKGGWADRRPGERPTEGFQKTQFDTGALNDHIMEMGKAFVGERWNGYVKDERNKNEAQVANTYGDALIAVKLGIPGAMGKVLNGIAELRRMEDPFYDPAKRNSQNEDYARLLEKLKDGGGHGGSGSRKELEEKIENWRKYYIDSVVEGRMAGEEAKSMFINDIGTLAEESGYKDINEFEKLYADKTKFFGFWNDVMKAITAQDPGYKAAFESLNVYLKEWEHEAKTPEEKALRHSQGEKIALLLYDTIIDSYGPARLPPEQIQKEAARLTGLLVGEKISFIKETADNSNEYKVGVDFDKDFGRALFEREQHPWARFVIGTGGSAKTYNFGDQKYQEQFEGEALDKFQKITGVPLSALKIGHSKEGQFDEAAELNIIVSGKGEENGTYRFKGDKDGNYWIEKQSDGGWERDSRYTMSAKEAEKAQWEKQREEHAEAQKKAEKEAAEKGARETFEMIEKETNPERRQALALALQGDTFNPVSPDEFWKRGINPNSGEGVKQIPADAWDRILSKLSGHEQEIQKNKWWAKGITRGNK